VLRLTRIDIRWRLQEYRRPTITENINRAGGLDEGGVLLRLVDLDAAGGTLQMTLFDGR
jgi:hypothetical protein